MWYDVQRSAIYCVVIEYITVCWQDVMYMGSNVLITLFTWSVVWVCVCVCYVLSAYVHVCRARSESKPVWRLLCDLTPAQLVSTIDFRWITDMITPEEAIQMLEKQVQHSLVSSIVPWCLCAAVSVYRVVMLRWGCIILLLIWVLWLDVWFHVSSPRSSVYSVLLMPPVLLVWRRKVIQHIPHQLAGWDSMNKNYGSYVEKESTEDGISNQKKNNHNHNHNHKHNTTPQPQPTMQTS